MHDIIILFLALLAVLCQVFVVGIVALRAAALRSAPAQAGWVQVREALVPLAIPFAFAVALVTMLGSVYMSEVKHFTPCRLCWTQRSLLYPQVLFMALLWWRPTLTWVRRLSVVLLALDLPVSTYHYLLEWYPSLETSVCSTSVPCNLVYVREFHYVSLPLMALTSALTVMTLLGVARPTWRPTTAAND